MPIQFPDLNIDPNIQARTAFNTALNTLSGVNQARSQYLQNQAASAQVPYAGPQAAANLGLTQAQAQVLPYTAVGSLLSGMGRAVSATSPFAYLRNAPEQVKDIAAGNQVQGVQNVGQVPIPNYSSLQGGIMSMVGNLLAGKGVSAQGVQSVQQLAPQSPQMNGVSNTDATTNALRTGSLILNSQDQQKLQQVFPGSAGQANQLASNLNQQAQNRVASPGLVQKYNYAKNVATTFKTLQDNYGIPAISFSPYMGAKGAAQLVADKAAVAAGKSVPRYENYTAFVNTLPILKDQITQFFGASITPSAQEELDKAVDPATWQNNPSAAMMAYNTLSEILRTEGQTAAQTAGKTNEYNQSFPQFDAKSAYQQLAANPSIAGNVIGVMTPQQQAALRAEHLRRKGGG